MPKQIINPLKNYPDLVSCKIENLAEKAREEGERESAINFWSPWLAEVLLREFVRENWLRERDLSVKRYREKTKSRLNEREKANLL